MTGGGVDPFRKHWKYALGGSAYCAGTISEGDPGKRIIEVYGGVFSGEQKTYAINAQGQILGSAAKGGELWQKILTAAESAFDYQFAEVALVIKNWSQGDTVPDWETFELI